MSIHGRTLLAFVDFKDPFAASGIAEDPQPGPVLSIAAARTFDSIVLFSTADTRQNAEDTRAQLHARHGLSNVLIRELPIANAKDYSAVMGILAREVRALTRSARDIDVSVCVSSGTAEKCGRPGFCWLPRA